ncbi:MAG TPA: tetratricopeptide repeat protein [Isosphaeraceae bacterium]|jgi:tetratricopeptide (TPR) repeat protein|nr:tetratricopeptide repeat protein [Isosphaeraceae bacterium]
MANLKAGRLLAVVCPLFLAQAAAPARGAGWVGKVVVRTPNAQKPRTKIGTDHDTTDSRQLVLEAFGIQYATYRVVRERGSWLWVVAEAGEAKGWLMTSEVLTLNRAIDLHTGVIQAHPDNWLSFSMRGIYLARRGEFDRAVADYDEAIRLKPELWPHFANRALIQFARHEYEAAFKDLDQVVEHVPNYALAYGIRGVVRHALGDFDKAIADENEAIRLRPKWCLPLCARSAIWAAKGEPVKAISDADQAIELDADNARCHAQRAWILATCADDAIRDGKRALESATRACKLTNWHDAFSLAALAAASAEVGDFKAAVRWQKKSMTEVPPADELAQGDAGSILKLYEAHKPFRHAPVRRPGK